MFSKVGSFRKEWEADIWPKEPGVVARTTADGYTFFLPCHVFKTVSSLSTSVLKCELYWDMRWALRWVSLGIDGRLGGGRVIGTELLVGNTLLVALDICLDLGRLLVLLEKITWGLLATI